MNFSYYRKSIDWYSKRILNERNYKKRLYFKSVLSAQRTKKR